MWVGLLTDRINNKLEKSNLINEHALSREAVPLRHASNAMKFQPKFTVTFHCRGSCEVP